MRKDTDTTTLTSFPPFSFTVQDQWLRTVTRCRHEQWLLSRITRWTVAGEMVSSWLCQPYVFAVHFCCCCCFDSGAPVCHRQIQEEGEVRWVQRNTQFTIHVKVFDFEARLVRNLNGWDRCTTQPGLEVNPVPGQTSKLARLTPFYSIAVSVVRFFRWLPYLPWQPWLIRLRLM